MINSLMTVVSHESMAQEGTLKDSAQILFCPDVSTGHFQKLFPVLVTLYHRQTLLS